METTKKQRLGENLLSIGKITEEQLKEGLKYHKEKGIPLGKALEQLGYISEHDIIEALSKLIGVPYVALLEEASEKLLKVLDLEKILTYLLKTAKKGINADLGTVYVLNNEKNELLSKVLEDDYTKEIRLPLGKGIAGSVAISGKTIILDDAYKDPRFNREIDDSSGYKTKSILCTPIKNHNDEIVGVFQMINKIDGNFNSEDERFLRSLSNFSATALELATLNESKLEKNRLDTQLQIARDMQLMLFPKTIPKLQDYEIFGFNSSSEEVSGDYFDFFPADEKSWMVAIGDVAGKGIPASLLMAVLQSHLKAISKFNLPLVEMMIILNDYLLVNSTLEKFVTLFLGTLNTEDHILEYVNAGHNPPLMVSANGDITPLQPCGPIIGMFPGLDYSCKKIAFQPGDVLFCFTDGVTEAVNKRDIEYGDDRLNKFLKKHASLSPEQIVDKSLRELQEYSKDVIQNDDITYLILKRIH